MKTKTNLRHLNRLESTNNVDGKVFTSRKISGVFSSYPVRNFCGFPAGDTPEPAVSQVPIRHNRSLRSLLFRLELDSRQNPVCNGYRRSWEMNDSFPRPVKTLNLCYITAR